MAMKAVARVGWAAAPGRGRAASSGAAGNRILVVGGNGYVGSAIARAALDSGLQVASLSRRGPPDAPQLASQEWVRRVEWLKGDVLQRDWRTHLSPDVVAVVSCVGAFGSNDVMEKVCGDTNIAACEEAAAAGVPRFVFISAHDYRGIGHGVGPLRGYFNGKRRAERRVQELFPQTSHILRPSFIYGTRHAGGYALPLGLVGAPLAAVCALPPVKFLATLPVLDLAFTSPVAVEAVARCAVQAATGKLAKPILDVDDILRA